MRVCYFLFNLSILICIPSCTQPVETTTTEPSATEDDKSLRYLKQVEWPKAYATQDTVLLDRILGDDFQMIDEDGSWYSKKDELDWIKRNRLTRDSFYYDIRRLDIFENKTALISGTGHVFQDGKHSTYQSSNLLIKRDGKWKAVASHVSGSKEVIDTVGLK